MNYQPLQTVRSTYRAEAVIDWIELTITTKETTQFQWLQDKMRRILDLPEDAPDTYIKPIDAGAGNQARRFTITLHDQHANSFKELERITSALSKKCPFASPPEVSGIEIALDFYSRNANNANLQSMTHRLQTSLAGLATSGNDPRQYDPISERNRFLRDDDKINPDQMLYIGSNSKRDPITWQVYHKVTDHNKQPLESNQHRARAEFTLTGTQLAEYVQNKTRVKKCVHLSDLQTFKFEQLAGLLHFRRLKSISEITAGRCAHFAYAIDKAGDTIRDNLALYPLGKLAYRRDPRTNQPRNKGLPEVLKHSRHSLADDDLNDAVHDKLRSLTRTFSTKF